MSRLWPDRLAASLAPESVALARVSGLLRPRVVAQRFIECDNPVAALGEALKEFGAERLKLTVVLSNRLVRYAIVPFDAALSGPDEELALARFHFTKIFGERAKSWDLRLSEGPHGAPRLASALDTGLADAIRAQCSRLVSIQPYLMAAFNRSRAALAKKPAWLVLPERERVCLALASKDGWQAVQTARLEADGWAGALERERLRLGAAAPAAVLVREDERYAMALAGV